MPLAYIDETGLHLPDYPAILDDLKARIKSVFGQDLYLEPDSQEGQLISIFALAVHDAYALAGSVYNAYSPQTAQGAGLARMVVINGIRRLAAGWSSVGVTVVGEAGTVIRGGIATDAASRRWLLPDEVVIPLSGEIEVTATADLPGDIRAVAGEINRIATPCRGWQSVTNKLAAVAGAMVETDAALRRRQAISTALPSRTVFEGTLGAVGNLSGVTRWRGYENDTDEPDKHGIPGHHICLVVEGGDNQAIADAVAAKKTPGTGTYGDIAVRVIDFYGVPNDIRFYRPSVVKLAVILNIKPLQGYVSTTADMVRRTLAAYVNSLPIGEDVLLAKLFVPGNLNNSDAGGTFDIAALTVGRKGQPQAAANIDIGYAEAAALDSNDIEIKEVV